MTDVKTAQIQLLYEMTQLAYSLRDVTSRNKVMQFIVIKQGTILGNSASQIMRNLGAYQNRHNPLPHERQFLKDFKIFYDHDDIHNDNGTDQKGDNPEAV